MKLHFVLSLSSLAKLYPTFSLGSVNGKTMGIKNATSKNSEATPSEIVKSRQPRQVMILGGNSDSSDNLWGNPWGNYEGEIDPTDYQHECIK